MHVYEYIYIEIWLLLLWLLRLLRLFLWKTLVNVSRLCLVFPSFVYYVGALSSMFGAFHDYYRFPLQRISPVYLCPQLIFPPSPSSPHPCPAFPHSLPRPLYGRPQSHSDIYIYIYISLYMHIRMYISCVLYESYTMYGRAAWADEFNLKGSDLHSSFPETQASSTTRSQCMHATKPTLSHTRLLACATWIDGENRGGSELHDMLLYGCEHPLCCRYSLKTNSN